MVGIRISPEKREQAEAMLRVNPNAAQVARELGLVTGTVCRWANKARIDLSMSPRGIEKRHAEMLAAVAREKNISKVAGDFDLDRRSLTRFLRAHGVPPSDANRSSKSKEHMKRRVADPIFQARRAAGRLLCSLSSAREQGNDERVKTLLAAASVKVKAELLKMLNTPKTPRARSVSAQGRHCAPLTD